MSYLVFDEYKINPTGSYKIIRNCASCGCKMHFVNTNNFRVNANGNMVDVWLIYQCEKCKHTYNLSIFERVNPSSINKEVYNRFLSNDVLLSKEYGNNKKLFIDNRAVIDNDSIEYEIVPTSDRSFDIEEGNVLTITNPFDIKLRVDKVLSEILGINRTKVKNLIKDNTVICTKKYIGKREEIIINRGLIEKIE